MSADDQWRWSETDLAVELWRVIVADMWRHPLAWWLGWL